MGGFFFALKKPTGIKADIIWPLVGKGMFFSPSPYMIVFFLNISHKFFLPKIWEKKTTKFLFYNALIEKFFFFISPKQTKNNKKTFPPPIFKKFIFSGQRKKKKPGF